MIDQRENGTGPDFDAFRDKHGGFLPEDYLNNPSSHRGSKATLPAPFVILMLFGFLGSVSGFIFYKVTPTTYQSEAAFKVEATGIKFPVENFDTERLLNERHDQGLARPYVIQRAIKTALLESLESFKELPEESDYVVHIVENLEVKQDEDDPKIYKVIYSESHAEDAQTVINAVLDAYETALETQLYDDIRNDSASLTELYEIANESLAQEKAKNASQGVIVKLEERIAEIAIQIQTLNYYTNGGLNKPKLMNFVVLQNGTYGEPTWPILHKCLLWGLLVGLMIGVIFLILMGLIKAFVATD